METGKTILEKEKRISKSKELIIKIYTSSRNPSYFKVYDENGNAKYFGKVTSEGPYDSCSCPSFYFGMKYAKPENQTVPFTSLYFAEHGHTFQCKHIIGAKDHDGLPQLVD